MYVLLDALHLLAYYGGLEPQAGAQVAATGSSCDGRPIYKVSCKNTPFWCVHGPISFALFQNLLF